MGTQSKKPANVSPELLQDYYTEEQFAAAVGRRPRTLKLWRQLGIGPKYIRLGHSCLYAKATAREWLASLERAPAE